MERTGLGDIKRSEGYIYAMLPSKIDQMKASHETGSEANFGFGHGLMPWNVSSEGSLFQFSDAAQPKS